MPRGIDPTCASAQGGTALGTRGRAGAQTPVLAYLAGLAIRFEKACVRTTAQPLAPVAALRLRLYAASKERKREGREERKKRLKNKDATIFAGTGPPLATSGLGSPLPTSAPGLGFPLPHLHRDWGSQLQRLRRDWASLCHICTGTGLSSATSAPGRCSPRSQMAPCPHACWSATTGVPG